jgi:putative Mg2+ transporter-C (MgtC) family protein
MQADVYEMTLRLLAALAAGAVIGYERSYHGRPAGFRTHALVCMASALLMLVTVYESHWMTAAMGRVQIDPTRMAQGIMTGIGFLGAGAIIKEGLTVRGLTTAASIWITAAIGILAGIGFYFPLLVSVVLTIGVLAAFVWIEARMPSQAYYRFEVRFAAAAGMDEERLRQIVSRHGFSIANLTYRMEHDRQRHHSMTLRSADRTAVARLADALEKSPEVLEFRVAPTGE